MKRFFYFLAALTAATTLWAETAHESTVLTSHTASADAVSQFTPAAFTVSASGKQVVFSSGNLQCTLSATDTVFTFAEKQTDALGTSNISAKNLASKIDLFGRSGNSGAAPWGISLSISNSDYAGDFTDWGNLAIGTHAAHIYRTLTKNEWDYLLNTRSGAANLYGVASIVFGDYEVVNGLILLPDNWTCPAGITFTPGVSSKSGAAGYPAHKSYTFADWQKLEANGAVFLPAAGFRQYNKVNEVNSVGRYASSTSYDSDNMSYLSVEANAAHINSWEQNATGLAVRLVQDIYTITVATPDNGTLEADKSKAIAEETVTLTITPASGYELDVLTVKDEAGNAVTVSADYTFTMPTGNVTVQATFKDATSTGTTHTTDNSGETVRKVFHDGQVYILRQGKTYNTIGTVIK